MRPEEYRYKLITEPAVEPVSLFELQDHIVQPNDDDALQLQAMITDARTTFEDLTGLCVIAQTWELTLPYFPAEILIRKAPLREISSIKYYDTSGDQQTLSSDIYRARMNEYGTIVDNAYNQTWPSTETGRRDAVLVTFIAGIYDSDSGSPVAVDTTSASYLVRKYGQAQRAIKILAGHWYDNPELVAAVQLHELPMSFQHIVNNCRVAY